MNRNLIAAFAAPSVALVAVALSATFADGMGLDRPAYSGVAERLSAQEVQARAAATFERADLDGSGYLDADEFASLSLITAELARLNGFVAFERDGEVLTVSLPAETPKSLTSAERTRIVAVARRDFYALADDAGAVTREAYLADAASRFAAADRSNSGALTKNELVAFAAREAQISQPEV